VITRIEAYSYRCFPELVVDLDRYHVLAGANGAGKTTLLDIPVLIGDILRGQGIVGAFLERQDTGRPARASTLTDLLHKDEGDAIAFAFEARLPESVTEVLGESSQARLGRPVPTHLRYELRLEITPRAMRVADEYLFLFIGSGERPEPGVFPQGRSETRSETGATLRSEEWQSVIHRAGGPLTQFTPESTTQSVDLPSLRVSGFQLAIGAVPPDDTLFPAALWFSSLLRGGVVYFDPDWEALRSPAPPGLPKRLIASGQNMPWLALDLQDSDPGDFAAWIDHVRTALPQVKSIRVHEREEDHFAYFSIEYQGGYRVTSSGLSDGTLRILALTLLSFLSDEAMPRLLVTEEPENGIHPQAIETVLQSLSMLYDTQVWISTHSPIVLAQTGLRDVLATRLGRDGSVTVVPGNKHPQLRDWRGAIDIGSLFAAGILG
jgi:ABC-type branched-subunit amino acid transport system ATPase component